MVEQHRSKGRELGRLGFAVLTISDSKKSADDSSGAEITKMVEQAGHGVPVRQLVKDEAGEIRAAVAGFLARDDVAIVVTAGGTGITSRDVTEEALAPLAEKRIDGFGELFRVLSHREVGGAAMLSRAFAFVAKRKPVFCLPGSPKAVALAMRELVIPEAAHVVAELRR